MSVATPTRSWLPMAVVALGASSVVLLIGTDFVRQRATLADMAWIGAVSQVEVNIAVAHLWLEEHVTGDRVDLPGIDRRLEESLALSRAMQGTDQVAAPTPVRALEDEGLARQAADLEGWLLTFQAISRERLAGYESGDDVGIGSAIDISYDDVFAQVFAQTQRLSAALDQRLTRGREQSRRVFWAVVVAWSALVVVAAAGLWTRERRRLEAEADLRRSQEQLMQSQKMDAVGRLAGGLAHDLNNFLAAIRGHCELVRLKQPVGEVLVAKMDRAIEIIQRAATMIGRLQTFSHRQPSRFSWVGLGAVVESMATMIGPTLGDHIHLRTDVKPDLWPVSADRTQLEQLIVNLLVNARDAMPGGGTVDVAVANLPGAGARVDQVVLTVADTGVGIPAAIRDKLFEPFVTTKTTKAGRHSGLGLAIVFSIVDQHGGSIEVLSEEGHGALFRVTLPRCSDEQGSDVLDETLSGVPLGGDERILLVDDDDAFRDATRALLEELGYHVEAAADGAAALALCTARDYAFDLVLTDVVMPGIGGRELVEKIRRHHHDVKVVFMSGHSERMLSRYGVESGEVQVLKNLVAGEALARRIRGLLDDAV